MGAKVLHFFDNIESYICRTLLAVFVLLLFMQIVAREVAGYSFSWTEELSTYMFVWFVFLGASYAAKMSAHNRVTFQLNFLPPQGVRIVEGIADLFWLFFNVYFIYLSFNFVFFKMNLFWKSQTLGVPMKYIYMILPLAFTLMTIRILQVNYMKLVKGIDVRDPEKLEVEKMIKEGKENPDAGAAQK